MSGAKARSDAPVAENVSGGGGGGSGGGGNSTAASQQRDRKPGGGVLKRLKSRRSQVDSRPVTEEDLRTQSGAITPEDVLGLRLATRGLRPSYGYTKAYGAHCYCRKIESVETSIECVLTWIYR